MTPPEHRLVQDISTRWKDMLYNQLLKQRWPVTVTLFNSSVTKRGKRFLDFKPDWWSLLGELPTALKASECATIFMSGEKYITVSAVPLFLNGVLKCTQSAAFEIALAQASKCHRAAAAVMEERNFSLRNNPKHNDPLHCPGGNQFANHGTITTAAESISSVSLLDSLLNSETSIEEEKKRA